jgi:hypothetical protein
VTEPHHIKPTTRHAFLVAVSACLPPDSPSGYAQWLSDVLLDILPRLQQVWETDQAQKPHGFYGEIRLRFEGGQLRFVSYYEEGPLLKQDRHGAKKEDAA